MYNNNFGFNPYYQSPTPRFQPAPSIDPATQAMPTQAFIPPTNINKPVGLLGKSVDSIEVVKAMDIPLDGSVSYFPLTDGSAIVTKQLQSDGTSKTITYKPIIEEDKKEKKEEIKYITIEDLQESMKNIDLSKIDDFKNEIKDEIKELRKEFDNFKKIKEKR